MYKGIDAVGVDMQPIENYNEYMAVFYITYLLVVGFFVVNSKNLVLFFWLDRIRVFN